MLDLAEFYVAQAPWIWLALAVAILAVEVATGADWLLWPTVSAAVVSLLTLLIGLAAPAALAVFAVLTIAATLLARRYFPRAHVAAGGDINDNVGRLVGKEARAAVGFVDGSGRVLVDGKEWAAELEEGEALAVGTRVEVTGVADGSRLRVRPSA